MWLCESNASYWAATKPTACGRGRCATRGECDPRQAEPYASDCQAPQCSADVISSARPPPRRPVSAWLPSPFCCRSCSTLFSYLVMPQRPKKAKERPSTGTPQAKTDQQFSAALPQAARQGCQQDPGQHGACSRFSHPCSNSPVLPIQLNDVAPTQPRNQGLGVAVFAIQRRPLAVVPLAYLTA